jgi:CBS domain-containing protein
MTKKINELMSRHMFKMAASSSVSEAARKMRAENIGAIIVEDGGRMCGIVTDRDIAVRVVADGRDPNSTPLSAICSKDLTTISLDEDIDRAIQMMRQKAIRRIPVVDMQGRPVGMISLGDLALERDSRSVLGQISAAPPNQ